MAKLEDPELTSSYRHNKIIGIMEQLLTRKTRELAENIFNNKDVKEEPTITGQIGGLRHIIAKTHAPGQVSHKWEDNYICKDSSQRVRGPSVTLSSQD